jgi:two-component system, NarL family, sensor kinase
VSTTPAHESSRDARQGVGGLRLAAIRAALVPVVIVGELLVDGAVDTTAAFLVVISAFALWAAALLALHIAAERGGVRVPRPLERAEPFMDLGAIVALTYTSGGPFSATAMALFVLPLLAAARLRPRLTAAWAAAAVAAYVLLSVAHPSLAQAHATARMVDQVGYLMWIGAAATLLSSSLARRDAAIARLVDERSRLALLALTADQDERRRLAELLHDESIQTLSLARQELLDFKRVGREDSFARAEAAIRETIEQLRGQIFELHPYVLDHAGLGAALRTIADRFAAGMGAEIAVAVDPVAAGQHDELIVVLARELLANAAKHSSASHVALVVAADAERVELEVRDDGVGFDTDRRAEALQGGHIGLASSEQRVRAAGGELEVVSRPDRGTAVRATLPSARAPTVPEQSSARMTTGSTGPSSGRTVGTRLLPRNDDRR